MILGIDEVGRGPWAGPLVLGAVVLGEHTIEGLADSKALTKRRREILDEQIRAQACGWALGWVEAAEIDELGLSASLALGTRRAVEQISVPYHEIIIDGTVNFLADTSRGSYVTTLKKADALIASVSAASIIAKVARDRYMADHDDIYPGYGFASHAGYGTAAHRAAIEQLGVTPLHRLSFKPLQKYADKVTSHDTAIEKPTTKSIGDAAESLVAQQLERDGHTICHRNWRTRRCEIDIVSRRDDVFYFTEVKYRRRADHGDGLAAVTAAKQRQMRFAAEVYRAHHQLQQYDARLLVAAVSGEPPTIEAIVAV